MNFFENLTQLRENPTDVTCLPHRQLASKVFGMVHKTYMTNWDEPVRLRPDVTPEMLEACFSRVFGKTAMASVVELLPELVESYGDDNNVDDIYLALIEQRQLLAETAEKSAWGSPSTTRAHRIAFLAFCLVGYGEYAERFVAQAKKRIETLH
jgi:hypothetical protein